MTVADNFDSRLTQATQAERPGAAFMRRLSVRFFDAVVAIWIFCGGIVLIEPSPYELMFVIVLPMAIVAGLGLYRSAFGLFAIMLGFAPFAIVAAFQVTFQPISSALIFTAVTIFLLLTSYFLANFVAEKTEQRMRLVIGAYTVAAIVVASIGLLAYLGAIPGAELFVRYGRAKATFKDPNVYGPFLVLPAMFALQRVLLGRGWQRIMAGGIYMLLFVGVFVSFSRAAWGHFAFSSAIVLALVFFLEASAREKVRLMIMSMAGVLVLLIALAGLLSIPAIGNLFETRASSQNYDTGETGRFGRQAYAYELALAHPWGIGPGEFSNMRVREEPHNVYVSVLHVYGWGGGFFYYLLIILTLWKCVQIVARPSPYRLMAIPVVATFVMLAGEGAIIDSDHWRHFYLLVGLIWGLSTAIQNDRRELVPREQRLV